MEEERVIKIKQIEWRGREGGRDGIEAGGSGKGGEKDRSRERWRKKE